MLLPLACTFGFVTSQSFYMHKKLYNTLKERGKPGKHNGSPLKAEPVAGWSPCCLKGRVCDSCKRLLIFKFNSQSKLHPYLLCSCSNVLIGWNCVRLDPRHYVCFPFTEPRLCTNNKVFLECAHTEPTARGLKEQFADFDKGCIRGLYLKASVSDETMPLLEDQ